MKNFLKSCLLEKTFDLELYPDEFMRDPTYRHISDFQHNFSLYNHQDFNLNFVKVKKIGSERFFLMYDFSHPTFDFYFDINQSKCLYINEILSLEDLWVFIKQYYLPKNIIINTIEKCGESKTHISYEIFLSNNFNVHLIYVPKKKIIFLFKCEELIPTTFIELFHNILDFKKETNIIKCPKDTKQYEHAYDLGQNFVRRNIHTP